MKYFFLKALLIISYKLFPPKRRLLTIEEYNREAQDYTAKALTELKEFCKSPDCNSWKVLSRLKKPDRCVIFHLIKTMPAECSYK